MGYLRFDARDQNGGGGGGSTPPGGASGQFQFNDSGAFGGAYKVEKVGSGGVGMLKLFDNYYPAEQASISTDDTGAGIGADSEITGGAVGGIFRVTTGLGCAPNSVFARIRLPVSVRQIISIIIQPSNRLAASMFRNGQMPYVDMSVTDNQDFILVTNDSPPDDSTDYWFYYQVVS